MDCVMAHLHNIHHALVAWYLIFPEGSGVRGCEIRKQRSVVCPSLGHEEGIQEDELLTVANAFFPFRLCLFP